MYDHMVYSMFEAIFPVQASVMFEQNGTVSCDQCNASLNEVLRLPKQPFGK